MRIPRVMPGLLLLLVATALSGCAQTRALRSEPGGDVKTTASVGDKALPIVAGEPGGSLRADTADPDLPRRSRGRISGRVYDDEGRPVANARVRLALGDAPAGKAVYANTDRSGAFTLGGLRPGSEYTVIAEYQGDQGMMSGRADADAPDSNVRISLHLRDVGIGEKGTQTASRSQPAKVKAISKIESIDEEEEPLDDSVQVNREDLGRPESDDAVQLSRADARRPRSSKSTMVRLDPQLDLDSNRDLSAEPPQSDPQPGWSSTSKAREAARRDRPIIEDDGFYEDDNPLPPAREVGAAGGRRDLDPPRTATRSQRRNSSRIADEAPPADEADWISDESDSGGRGDDAPRPLPEDVGEGGRVEPSRGFGPITIDESEPIPTRPASPGRSRNPQRVRKDDFPKVPEDDPQALLDRPTWSEITRTAGAIPLDEAIVKTEAVGGASAAAVRTADLLTTTGSRPLKGAVHQSSKPVGSPAPSMLPERKTGPFCDFDPSEPRLNDFGLVDLSGRLVSFRDLDADLILLDFWGTWCVKCATSIPHLNALQAKLGGKKLQVVGIACEQTEANRAAKVEAVVKKMGINYTVLLTGMDGKCPVQEAFQVRFYPTMILLDRNGRILCRQEGATAETLARIDRYIAKNLDGAAPAAAAGLATGPGAARR